jgi:hypothetical protein
MHVHHTGSQEETPVEVPEEQDVPVPEVHMDEEAGEELQECLDHWPSSFERGKPQSISLRMVCKLLILHLLCLMH